MRARGLIVVILLLIFGIHSYAQRTETALNFDERANHVNFEFENDFLFESDHYYTGGLSLYVNSSHIKKTPTQFIVKPKSEFAFTFSGFGLQQRLFTPYSITEPFAIKNDRPYCAYLLLSNYTVLVNPRKHLKISNEFGIGVLGPLAKGGEFQSGIHELIGSVLPVGWENQLSNSLIIDYQIRIEKDFFSKWTSEHIIPIAELRIGTLRDELALGLMFKLGNSTYFLTHYGSVNKNKFVWDFVVEAKFKGVVYDGTLNGRPGPYYEDGALPHSQTSFHQYHFRMGVNLYFKGVYIRYMYHMNSKDFINGLVHQYGGIILGVAF